MKMEKEDFHVAGLGILDVRSETLTCEAWHRIRDNLSSASNAFILQATIVNAKHCNESELLRTPNAPRMPPM